MQWQQLQFAQGEKIIASSLIQIKVKNEQTKSNGIEIILKRL